MFQRGVSTYHVSVEPVELRAIWTAARVFGCTWRYPMRYCTSFADCSFAQAHKPISPSTASTSIVTGLIQASIVSCALARSTLFKFVHLESCLPTATPSLFTPCWGEEFQTKSNTTSAMSIIKSITMDIVYIIMCFLSIRKCSERSIIESWNHRIIESSGSSGSWISSLGSGHGNAESDGHLIAHHAERRECPTSTHGVAVAR